MDTGAKYFLVLVALCEPRLRHGGLAPVPTNPEVVRRLQQLPGCERLSREAVDFHVDYVARTKFRLRPDGQGFAARREAVVGFALRFGVVGEDHLRLLPARGRAAGATRADAPCGKTAPAR
jgi:serine/threonine-protein kinase